jgi:non-canonical poly(A) RNA polymerase PAPD5/7
VRFDFHVLLSPAYRFARLHQEVKAFTEWVSPSPVEDEIRALTVQMISEAVTKKFPDAKVYPFGSYETKLYLPQGYIQITITLEKLLTYVTAI